MDSEDKQYPTNSSAAKEGLSSVEDNSPDSNITRNFSSHGDNNSLENTSNEEYLAGSFSLEKDDDTTFGVQNSTVKLSHTQIDKEETEELVEDQFNSEENVGSGIEYDEFTEETASKLFESSPRDFHTFKTNILETAPRAPQAAFSSIQSNDHSNERFSQNDIESDGTKATGLNSKISESGPRAPQAALSSIQSNDHDNESDDQLDLEAASNNNNQSAPIMAVPVDETVVVATTLDMLVEDDTQKKGRNKFCSKGRRTKTLLLTIIFFLLLIILLLMLYLSRVKEKVNTLKSNDRDDIYPKMSDDDDEGKLKDRISKIKKSGKDRKLDAKYNGILQTPINVEKDLN